MVARASAPRAVGATAVRRNLASRGLTSEPATGLAVRHLCGLSSALQTRKHISHQRPSGRLCHGYGCGPPPSGRRRTCGARWPRAPSVISLRVAFGGVGAPGRGTPGVAAVFWSAVAVGLLAAPSRARGRARVWRRRPAACGPCAAGCVAARGARVGPPRSGGARSRGRAATLWCRARRAVVVVRGLRALRWLRGLRWLRWLRSRSCGGCGDEGCAIRRNSSSRIYRSAAVAAQFCDSAQFGKPEILGAFGLGPRSRSARLLEAVSG